MMKLEQVADVIKVTTGISMDIRSIQDSPERTALQAQNDESQVIAAAAPYIRTPDGEVWFTFPDTPDTKVVLAAQVDQISETEARLISLYLSTLNLDDSRNGISKKSKPSEETSARQIGSWILEQLEGRRPTAVLPDSLRNGLPLVSEMIPFMLVNESDLADHTDYKVLHRLLRTYFDGNIVLIPLEEKEWLILADPALLNGFIDEKEPIDSEGEHSQLFLFCMGIYELVSNEWGGDYHLSAIPAVRIDNQLADGVSLLRETLLLGRIFQVKESIHLSSGLHLERLLFHMPEAERNRFLEEYASHHLNVFEDEETMSTLERFFELDCNVSETAKQLYIHRNTLLYRLDKIKQETGLDVRSFQDAVLGKISLLLYKLTKRL